MLLASEIKQEKLQLNPDLTLERAKEIRQKEAVREQANQFLGVAEGQVMGVVMGVSSKETSTFS